MKELIRITERDGKQAVSARELHAFLGSKKDFSSWIKDRIKKYGLALNQDFTLLTDLGEQNKRGGHNKIEYVLSLDCAKELAMLEGNAKGRQARKYFIECEKQLQKVYETLEVGQQNKIRELLNSVEQMVDRMERSAKSKQITSEVHEFTVFGYTGLTRKNCMAVKL